MRPQVVLWVFCLACLARIPLRAIVLVGPLPKEPFLLKTLAGSPAGTTVVPGGAGLVFASGLTGGDSMFSYMPMELPDAAADERLRVRWNAKPPRMIVWSGGDLSVTFGVQGFGMDYAVRAGKWVEANYRPITPAASDFVVLVLRQ